MAVSKKWCKLDIYTDKHEELNFVFANHRAEEEIYPLTTIEIAKAQRKDQELKVYFNSLSAKSVLAGEKLVAMYSIST